MHKTIEKNVSESLKPGETWIITTNHQLNRDPYLQIADATQDDAILSISLSKERVTVMSKGGSPILRRHMQGHQPLMIVMQAPVEFSRGEKSFFIPYFSCVTDRPCIAEFVVEFEDDHRVSITYLA